MSQLSPPLYELESVKDKLSNMVGAKLFHAARILTRPDEEDHADLKSRWDEFLPGRRRFEYRRAEFADGSLVVHTCFFGSAHNLDSFNGPAYHAAQLWPDEWRDGVAPNPADHDAIRERNLWLRVVYEMISKKSGLSRLIGIITNVDSLDRKDFDPVGLLGIHNGAVHERFQRWLKVDRAGKEIPHYIYVRPVYNVFKISFEAIKYLIDHLGEFYPSTVRLEFDEPAPSTVAVPNPEFTPKDIRNQRFYDLALTGMTYGAIRYQITTEFPNELHLRNESSVRKAAKKHAEKFVLDPIPDRRT